MRRAMLLLSILVFAPVLYLFACSEGPVPWAPPRSVADRLELKLAKHPCVGSLQQWERNYTFKSEPFLVDFIGRFSNEAWRLGRWYDYGVIEIDLRKVGREAVPEVGLEASQPGRYRHALMPHHQGIIDDSGWPSAMGYFDIATDKIDVWAGCRRIFHLPRR